MCIAAHAPTYQYRYSIKILGSPVFGAAARVMARQSPRPQGIMAPPPPTLHHWVPTLRFTAAWGAPARHSLPLVPHVSRGVIDAFTAIFLALRERTPGWLLSWLRASHALDHDGVPLHHALGRFRLRRIFVLTEWWARAAEEVNADKAFGAHMFDKVKDFEQVCTKKDLYEEAVRIKDQLFRDPTKAG